MPLLLNLRGYTAPDPLDKATGYRMYLLLITINLILSVVLLYLITASGIVQFNGFTAFGYSFSPLATMGLEVITNCLIFSPLIILARKCSSLIPYLIVFLPYYLLDLFIDSHYRCASCDGNLALWTYGDDSIVSPITIHALKFFITISVDAILFGILGLFLARLTASAIYRKNPWPPGPTTAQYADFFKKEWSEEDIAKPKRDFAFYILRILGMAYLIYLVILILGSLGSAPWPSSVATLMDMTYANPALAINTYFKITLMIILAFTAAFNKNLRYYCCLGLATGHLISTAYSLIFHFLPALQATDSPFLLVSGILDGAMVLIFVWVAIKYKKDGAIFAPEKDTPIDYSLPMTLLKYLYMAMGIFFSAMVVIIVATRLTDPGDSGIGAVFGSPDPMIGNTVTLYSTLALVSFLQVRREQLRAFLFNPLIVPLLFGSLLSLIWIIVGDITGGVFIQTRKTLTALTAGSDAGAPPAQADWYFILYAAAGLGISGLMISLRRLFYRVDYSINTIDPSAAIDAQALTDAFYGGSEKEQALILQSIDDYVSGIKGRKRGLLNLPFGLFENVLNFVYGLRPSFSAMNRDEQRYYLRKYFLRNQTERNSAFIPPLAELAYQIGMSLNSIITFAQYNSLNARNNIGYVPVDARDRTQGDCAAYPPPYKKIADLPKDHLDPKNFKPATPCADGPLIAPRVTTPVKEDEIPAEVDYIIIGSGAGGATMAYRLACGVSDPSKILVVETGKRYQPLQDFQDNEIEMMKQLYKESGLQQTKNFTMTLVQGQCVGGTTVVNNAVCFKMPDAVHQSWEKDYGIDLTGLDAEYDLVQKELNIQPLGPKGVNEKMKQKFVDTVTKFNQTLPTADQLVPETPVHVNHLNNSGDGNWNLGNKRMQKRSMLETFIPWSEARGVKVVSNTTAIGFTSPTSTHPQNPETPTTPNTPSATPQNPSSLQKADCVLLRAANGKISKVTVRKAIIVAAGAVASSHFLMGSNIPNPNIGKNLSCNFAFPVTYDFEDEIRAFDGDQITLAALDPHSRSAFETYFNPPASFAITSVPFFFQRRDSIMSRYKYLGNFGSLIGSEPNGIVLKKADLFNGQAFTWELGQKDISNIKYAFSTLVQFGQLSGARRVILPTKPGIELDLTKTDSTQRFLAALNNYPLRIEDLYLGTAHPQGGNLMAHKDSAHASDRVVDEHFRVAGYSNVFVADVSLFPTSITVNPQWTIMAMSSLAARSVLALCP
jgi:GMC oxidoreductase